MNCTIRSWQLSDAPALAKIANNPKIKNNLRDGFPSPYRLRDAEEFILTVLLNNKELSFAILADGQLAGSIGAVRQADIHRRTAELGYFIAEDFWGKGIGTKAVQQTCDHLFATTDLLRIFAEPFSHNTGSCRVLEKAGFQLEGILHSNAIKDGQVIDMKMYAKIKE
ncbi:N-acetyltransferase [Enterococcus florum]|uniref:N-acetyltransferase n=1 Tax=Enterococcus florum TaxID=2480627 RepID=A0A4P5PL29_9ENTE|nr:GNAT family N-acetyltransferase [Enterococcus florum]GCF94013.1 N-acetyltransferase [Enterococcus florum]